MNNEKLRVNARMMLVGKTHTGNLLAAFSAFLRVALLMLSVVAAWRFDCFFLSDAGRALFGLSCVALMSGILLLECTRTVKDRWYSSLCSGEGSTVTELMTAFSLHDMLLTLKISAVSFFCTLIRLTAFYAFPLAALAFSVLALKRGVSRNVMAVAAVGNLILLSCGTLFSSASINCVSLARSLSCMRVSGFVSRLRMLECSAFSLLRFDLLLSVFNRSHRRLSKLVFVRNLLEKNGKV